MGVGAGLYMYDVIVKSSRSLSHLLMSSCTQCDLPVSSKCDSLHSSFITSWSTRSTVQRMDSVYSKFRERHIVSSFRAVPLSKSLSVLIYVYCMNYYSCHAQTLIADVSDLFSQTVASFVKTRRITAIVLYVWHTDKFKKIEPTISTKFSVPVMLSV